VLPDEMLKFIRERAPWEANPDALLARVHAFPLRYKADTLAKKLGITNAIRTELGLTCLSVSVLANPRAWQRRERDATPSGWTNYFRSRRPRPSRTRTA
jgi:hypothetical protein